MGLDMYLNASRYISTYKYSPEDQAMGEAISKIIGTPVPDDPLDTLGRVEGVTIRVGYWRKANAIHAWFVREVQGGDDDCGDYRVARQKLLDLRKACQSVIETPGMAASLLPTQSGFFFGGTEYDEGYLADLQDTIKIIDRALAFPDIWEFEYHSSW